MKKIKCSSQLTIEEFTNIMKYGNYAYSKVNMNFVSSLLLFFFLYIFIPEIEIVIIILSILFLMILTYKIDGTNLLIKKQNKVNNYPLNVKTEFDDNNFLFMRPVLGKNESIEIPYSHVSYIMETDDFIILNLISINENTPVIPIKKRDLDVEVIDFKKFILERCKNLGRFKITNPKKMYAILQICRVLYVLFIISILFCPEIFA